MSYNVEMDTIKIKQTTFAINAKTNANSVQIAVTAQHAIQNIGLNKGIVKIIVRKDTFTKLKKKNVVNANKTA